MFRHGALVGKRLACIGAKVDRSFSCVELHKSLLSAADKDMIGLAVPERRKSASLTELINASCTTAGAGSIKLSDVIVDEGAKCTVSRKGSAFLS